MRFKKVVYLNIEGLKCDHCDWIDMGIEYKEYDKYINAKCPVCGSVVLTPDDYNTVKRLVLLTKIVSTVLYPISFLFRERETLASMEMNGTGKLNIKKDTQDDNK